jgi:TubC N-terminal docking domain
MTPAAFLAYLINEVASVVVIGDRLRVEAPAGLLTSAIRKGLAANKAALLELLQFVDEYRAVLADTTVDDTAFRDAQIRLIDELGPALATAIHRSVHRDGGRDSGVKASPPTLQGRRSTDGAARG